MSRKAQLALFLLGGSAFAYILSRIGFTSLLASARATWWVLIPLVAIGGVVYLCNSAATWLVLADEPSRPPFGRVYALTVSGFSLNFLTPMVNLGGEPYKAAGFAPWLGGRRAAGVVIVYQMLHTLGMILTFLAGIALALLLVPSDPRLAWSLTALFVALVAAFALLLWVHREGGLERLLDFLHRVPGLSRVARLVEPRRESLALLDEQIRRFYRAHRARFALAVLLEFLGRGLLLLEYYFVLLSLSIDVGLARGFMIGALASLASNVLFFLPYELGAKEGSLYVLFRMVGLRPALGVYAALIARLRDLAWIGIGLLLIWAAGRRAPAPAGAGEPS
ncbi:MAG TPA: lysylphosphatidylglycerol synthase transmembrane domain-containing protein [Gemmatimonadales bacterium]|nr:lysylphosphatidylglycerol synthase transmembrane domain-containing protein [Gemmatimonadales bacterium]